MDDELPLTALAKPKKSSYDDDLPLAKLAGAAASKGRPSLGAKPGAKPLGAKPGVPGQVQGKPVRKKAVSSSSSSSDSSDSSDSSSESGGKKKVATKKKRLRLIAKKKVAAEDDDGEDNAENKVKKKERTPKEQVVVDLLCRWWYCIGDWPPNDPAFYTAELKKKSLRRVSIQEWEWVPELDEKGLAKVYELSQFKGVYRKGDGEMVDIRPMETCPSYNNFMKKDLPELYGMLVTAYETQIKELNNSKYYEKSLDAILKTGLTRIREKAHQASQMQFNLGGATKKRKTE